jgi:hypothetical protein
MMKPAEDCYHCDAADLPGPPKIWRIFIQLQNSLCVVVMGSVNS